LGRITYCQDEATLTADLRFRAEQENQGSRPEVGKFGREFIGMDMYQEPEPTKGWDEN